MEDGLTGMELNISKLSLSDAEKLSSVDGDTA